jgi:phage terminase large subunit GpA-like protein
VKNCDSDIESILKIWEGKPSEPPPRYISEYVEGNRIMPNNTPIPGPWRNWRTQFGVEIMNELSPWSPTQHVDVMSSSQMIKSALLENTIGYYIKNPAPILFMSGTEALLRKWATKRLEPLIDSLDLRKHLIAPVENDKSRRTGDTTFQKLFNGGFLEMASSQSPSAQRADSVRILLLDEVDAAPSLLTTGEGFWDDNAEARTKSWGERRKILACSTPTEYQTSTIYRRFSRGDQCEYFVPCPLCGKFQILERGESQTHGLRAEMKNGEIDFIYYLCDYCHDAIFEHHKSDMIKNGRWEPKTKPERLRRSFHINSLYSLIGYKWIDYYTDYMNCKNDGNPEKMRVFTNHQDGMPYILSGERPKPERIFNNRGKYKIGEVPEDVLYLTVGIDVQLGSKVNANNPARLEMQVLGHGFRHRVWSIDYQVFFGDTSHPEQGSWELLNKYADSINDLTYTRRVDGFKFRPTLIFIDSGDGHTTSTVYQFCQTWRNTFPIKGQRIIERERLKKPDEFRESSYRNYNYKDGLYTISTVLYKNIIYENLKLDRQSVEPQKFGFIDFPIDYTEKYFDGLTAEEKMLDGSYESHGRRNEPLDTFVYALCAAEAYLDWDVNDRKLQAKKDGLPYREIEKIDHRFVIDEMIRQTAIIKK